MKKILTLAVCFSLVAVLISANLIFNADQAINASAAAEHQSHEVSSGGSTVYMTADISPDGIMAVYKALGVKLTGDNTAVKLSTGEPPASNYLDPDLIRDLVEYVDGTIVECNTAYGGQRSSTAMHYQVAEDHGFTDLGKGFVIMDEDGSIQIPVEGGQQLSENYVGAHFADYDGFLVLSHFKGHAMAGFGGAIKNISIGIGSQEGKCLIHTAGRSHTSPWGGDQDAFLESMADAGKSVVDYLDGNILFVNVMNRLSIDCDCDGNPAEPDIHDIGILASTDPVALDQACLDLIYEAEGNASFVRRVEGQNGEHVLEAGEAIGLGNRTYNIVNIDEQGGDSGDADVETNGIPGDVNQDGTVNIKDATRIQKHVADIVTLSESIKPYADVNGDGEISGTDTTHLQKYIVGLDVALSDPNNPSNTSKSLVVYFSASGNTERVAGYVADEANADIFEITPKDEYTSEDLNWNDSNSRVSREHNDESLRDVELTTTVVPNWNSYHTVYIGYPIWWGIAAWPVSSFVKANDFTGKTVIPFCTSSSSGLGQSGELLAEAAGTGDWLGGMRFTSGASEDTVREWVQSLS